MLFVENDHGRLVKALQKKNRCIIFEVDSHARRMPAFLRVCKAVLKSFDPASKRKAKETTPSSPI
jgi:hypothetical protein